MAEAFDVVVVGSSNIDLITYTERFPAVGETIHGVDFAQGFGGKGANQAVQAARLGARTLMVSKLGTDSFGDSTLANYRTQAVDTRFVSRTAEAPSGVATILVNGKGENQIVIVDGANALLSPADVDAALPQLSNARVLLCQLEVPLATSTYALRVAKARGVRTTIFNPAPALANLPSEVLCHADYVCPNESELALLSGLPVRDMLTAVEAAHALQQQHASSAPTLRIVVTLGAQGCVIVPPPPAQPQHVPAPHVTAVDTTGAGDSFLGAFAFFLSRGLDERVAVERANAVAAHSVQRRGTQTSFARREQLPGELFVGV